MNKKEKVVVIFIEGDTEVEFYKELVRIIREHCGGRLNCSVETINAAGIGQYKRKVLGIFEKQIKSKAKYDNADFYIALCYDQDVFELEKNPPVNWNAVKKEFFRSGAREVCQIKAVRSIEDWFLCDTAGVLRYLKLPADTKLPGGRGASRLEALFRSRNRVYIKGNRTAGLVQALDVEKILSDICPSIAPLCRLLGVKCGNQKKCQQTKP